MPAIESISSEVFGETWGVKLDQSFITELQTRGPYNFRSVEDLLRGIRNKFAHYQRIPAPLEVVYFFIVKCDLELII